MNIKILIADDDPYIRKLLKDILTKEGYQPIVASNGEQAIEILFETSDIELVILDVMMSEYNGWEVLKEIRTESEVPVMMLTALGDEQYELKGLSHGADEYLTKPFSYNIFTARVGAMLRRVKKQQQEKIKCGKIVVDQQTRSVFIEDRDCKLNKKEFSLLCYFIKNKDRVLTREQLITKIWGYDYSGNGRTLDTHIKTLRSKLGEYGKNIKTLRGVGYKFEGLDG